MPVTSSWQARQPSTRPRRKATLDSSCRSQVSGWRSAPAARARRAFRPGRPVQPARPAEQLREGADERVSDQAGGQEPHQGVAPPGTDVREQGERRQRQRRTDPQPARARRPVQQLLGGDEEPRPLHDRVDAVVERGRVQEAADHDGHQDADQRGVRRPDAAAMLDRHPRRRDRERRRVVHVHQLELDAGARQRRRRRRPPREPVEQARHDVARHLRLRVAFQDEARQQQPDQHGAEEHDADPAPGWHAPLGAEGQVLHRVRQREEQQGVPAPRVHRAQQATPPARQLDEPQRALRRPDVVPGRERDAREDPDDERRERELTARREPPVPGVEQAHHPVVGATRGAQRPPARPASRGGEGVAAGPPWRARCGGPPRRRSGSRGTDTRARRRRDG